MTPPPLLDLGGAGPLLHLAPANGFPFATYRPMLAGLFSRYRVVAVPPRALRPGQGPPPAEAGSWVSLAEDLVEGWRAHGLTGLIAVGHSFGAVASLLAANRAPDLVRALVMLDPTILPTPVMDEVAAARRAGLEPRMPLVQTALKRRARFDSPEEAFAYWRSKELFRDWADEALHHYVEGMLAPADGGWTLAWPPAWEAWYYRSFYPHTWDDLAALDPSLPLLVVRGERSDTFLPPAAARLQALLPRATLVELEGAGHLFPQSHPDATSRILADWLAEQAI